MKPVGLLTGQRQLQYRYQSIMTRRCSVWRRAIIGGGLAMQLARSYQALMSVWEVSYRGTARGARGAVRAEPATPGGRGGRRRARWPRPPSWRPALWDEASVTSPLRATRVAHMRLRLLIMYFNRMINGLLFS